MFKNNLVSNRIPLLKYLRQICWLVCITVYLVGCSADSLRGEETVFSETPRLNKERSTQETPLSPEQVQTIPSATSTPKTGKPDPGSMNNEPTLTSEPLSLENGTLPTKTQDLFNGEPGRDITLPVETTLVIGNPQGGLFPTAEIQILQPGEGAQVVSPFESSVMLKGPVEGPYRVELFIRDRGTSAGKNQTNGGKLIYRQVWAAPPGSEQPETTPLDLIFHIAIDFGIQASGDLPSAEEARLIVTRVDAHSRVQAVNSVDLLLQSSPAARDQYPRSVSTSDEVRFLDETDMYLEIHLQEPSSGARINGGEVMVSGIKYTSGNENTEKPNQLYAELVAEDGRVVGQRVLAVVPSSDGTHGEFSSTIPYRVSKITPVRLVVFEDGAPFSSYVHLSSLEIILEP